MAEYIDIDKSYDTATLEDWYINSVTDDAPIWTEEHLEELLNDFYVIPKDTPAADVVEVCRCRDCKNSRPLKRDDWFESLYSEECVWCMHFNYGMRKTDFCSDGERRSE